MPRVAPLAFACVFVLLALSGCGGKTTVLTSTSTTHLAENKGAITGLVIDDRYRPVPDALVLLTPGGLTATSDALGQFQFLDLEPGAYVLLAQAKDHEAAPKNADVTVGQYSEVELMARRIFSEEGMIITTEYSVFIDCSFETPVVAATGVGCSLDQTGDSTRASFDTHLAPQDANLTTYMVTEILFNQPASSGAQSGYGTVIGVTDSNNIFMTYYSEADLFDGTYQRIQNKAHDTNNRTGEDVGGRNEKWPPDKLFTTAIFPHGLAYQELHYNPTGIGFFGAGASLGVKAKIVQSVFLGEPKDDVETYAVLKP